MTEKRVFEGRLTIGGIVPPFDSLILIQHEDAIPFTDPIVHLFRDYLNKRVRITIREI